MGEDKSRNQTRNEAVAAAKRNAAESAITYVKSETEVKDFQLERDILDAYARASVRVIEMKELDWYKDTVSGECLKIWIKTEVIPDKEAMAKLAEHEDFINSPSQPLNISVWSDKPGYRKGEKGKIYLRGNKPYYARVVYRDPAGSLIQLLPNPYGTDTYFNGGAI